MLMRQMPATQVLRKRLLGAQVLRKHQCTAQALEHRYPLNAQEEEERRVTPASDGAHHLEQGNPVRKLQPTCGPALWPETSRRSGGEALRQGRIGESPRSAAGECATSTDLLDPAGEVTVIIFCRRVAA